MQECGDSEIRRLKNLPSLIDNVTSFAEGYVAENKL